MKEIEIPECCEAKIVGNKVVFVPKESEDERVRKKLIRYFNCYYDKYSCRTWAGLEVKKLLAYFEKQKPLSTEETELNSIAFLEQLGYTCVPPKAEKGTAELSEDERIRKALLRCCDDWEKGQFGCMNAADIPAIRAYLEKQKEQKSTEDVVKDITKNKEAATKFLKSAGIMDDNGELAEMYRSEQKPAEWSEEERDYYDAIIAKLEVTQNDAMLTHEQMSFLKSLRPQPYWKPSEEHFQGLRRAIIKAEKGSDEWNSLTDLYEYLKNL